MQRKARGVKLDGSIYDCLFEPALGKTEVVKKGAELSDTLHLFPEYVPRYAYQAERLAAKVNDIEGDVYKTCYNIWYILVNFIAYQPDKPGIEQIRSTNRLWADKLGDCDCFAFTISCVLHLLKIKHKLRITQYKEKDGFQHIYVVVSHRGKEIIIDACLEEFNKEVPYINKTEVEMDLHFLNGIDPESIARNGGSIDAQDLLSSGIFNNEIGSLFPIFNRANAGEKGNVQPNGSTHTNSPSLQPNKKPLFPNARNVIKKSIHVINRANPATTALRLGLLAGMKTNMFGIAEKLRYAYLSDQEATRRGLNMKRFSRFKRLREKMEKIFFTAGGKPENLKEAILTGKGNQNREVALNGYGHFLGNVSQEMQLKEILGEDMFYDEKADSLNGLNGELGVVTAAVITAASGILASIAAIIKNIGDLKQGGEPGSDQAMEELESQDDGADAGNASAPQEKQAEEPMPDENSGNTGNQAQMRVSNPAAPSADESTTAADGGATPPPVAEKGWGEKMKEFWDKNKTPILVVGGTLVAAGAIWLVSKYMGDGAKSKKSHALSGAPKYKGKGQKQYAGSKTLRKLKMKPLK